MCTRARSFFDVTISESLFKNWPFFIKYDFSFFTCLFCSFFSVVRLFGQFRKQFNVIFKITIKKKAFFFVRSYVDAQRVCKCLLCVLNTYRQIVALRRKSRKRQWHRGCDEYEKCKQKKNRVQRVSVSLCAWRWAACAAVESETKINYELNKYKM